MRADQNSGFWYLSTTKVLLCTDGAIGSTLTSSVSDGEGAPVLLQGRSWMRPGCWTRCRRTCRWRWRWTSSAACCARPSTRADPRQSSAICTATLHLSTAAEARRGAPHLRIARAPLPASPKCCAGFGGGLLACSGLLFLQPSVPFYPTKKHNHVASDGEADTEFSQWVCS